MSKLFGSVLAITVASVAAIAATTAMLNSPHRIGPATETTAGMPAIPPVTPPPTPPNGPPTTPAPQGKPATPESGPQPATPGGAATPGAPAGAGEAPVDAAAEPDQNPYDDIAPEELPPDLQYNADSSVSFPTNI